LVKSLRINIKIESAHFTGRSIFYSYLPRFLNFMATAMPESRLTETMIPSASKPPTTPPTIAATFERLFKGTKGESVCVCMCV
jgi:hypothetical protein